MTDWLDYIKWNDPLLYETYMKQKEGAKWAPFSSRRFEVGRLEPFDVMLVMLHNLRAESLLHLTIDILPHLWYNIGTVKERSNTYYD